MKRGATDYCLVLGVNKPRGMSSHDVVNRVRRIFGERRVGHTGTLDPLAQGVLPVCVGAATRLDPFLTGHDKTYRVRVGFGVSTATDDSEGEVLRQGSIPVQLRDPNFARLYLAGLVGKHKQLPPVYSAIKVNGKKACDQARKGNVIELAARDIEIYDIRFLGLGEGYKLPGDPSAVDEAGAAASPAALSEAVNSNIVVDERLCVECAEGERLWWDIECTVSKGTYIRSLARDIGIALDCPAHVNRLERIRSGMLALDECVSLDELERVREAAALDPVRLLGFRFTYAEGHLVKRVVNGSALSPSDTKLYVRRNPSALAEICACTSGVCESAKSPFNGELISVISENKLVALYRFDKEKHSWRPACVFQKGIVRGSYV